MSNASESMGAEKDFSGERAAESDFSRLFNLSLDLLCIAGLDGYLKRVNPSWTRVLGWSEAELLARPVADLMHPEDRERTLAARAGLARGVPVRGLENRYRCKDGSYRWLSWQSVTPPGADTVFAVARDVTERRELEHERLIVSKLESMSIMAGGLVHDFNNLLTGLSLQLELLPLSGDLNAMQRDHLRLAGESVQAAKGLTDRLIALVSRPAGQREACDVPALVRRAVELVLAKSSIRAEVRAAPDVWLVEGNAPQLLEVLSGLLQNAREASASEGRITVEVDNVPATPPAGNRVRIRITDHGAGIPAEILPKIFDPYFTTKRRGPQKGMGLGLTTCRVAIRDHGGTIAIASQPGAGTTVTVELPATTANRS